MIQRKNFPRTVFKALSMVVFFFFPLFPAFGQNFPNQPIDLFVGATAGGTQYLSSRALVLRMPSSSSCVLPSNSMPM